MAGEAAGRACRTPHAGAHAAWSRRNVQAMDVLRAGLQVSNPPRARSLPLIFQRVETSTKAFVDPPSTIKATSTCETEVRGRGGEVRRAWSVYAAGRQKVRRPDAGWDPIQFGCDFHGPVPRSPLHRLAVRLRHSRSNTSTVQSGLERVDQGGSEWIRVVSSRGREDPL